MAIGCNSGTTPFQAGILNTGPVSLDKATWLSASQMQRIHRELQLEQRTTVTFQRSLPAFCLQETRSKQEEQFWLITAISVITANHTEVSFIQNESCAAPNAAFMRAKSVHQS